jgi:dihydroorotase
MINIDMIATDHAPHTRQDKEQMIMSACPGFAGVETMLPLMINEVNKGRMSWQQLVKLTSHGPMEIFGVVEKGEILAGKDADIVVIDNSVDWTIEPNELHSKCGWTIFEGTEIRGAVDKVFKGGDLVVDGVEFYGKKGSGREIGF